MFCTNCGAVLAQNATFCSQCRAAQDQSTEERIAGKGEQHMELLPRNIGLGDLMRVPRALAWIFVLFSAVALVLGILIMTLTELGFFASTKVSKEEVQTRLNKPDPPADLIRQVDDLKSLFSFLDDDRWSQAKELIGGWVEEWSDNPKEKSLFLTELASVAKNFPPEQRSAALDAFYQLKQEKVREVSLRRQTSWLQQLGTFTGILVNVVIIGVFSLVLALFKIEKNTRYSNG